MRRRTLAMAAAAAAAASAPAASATPAPARIVIASDSTAADYPPDQFPQMGWGMFLRCSLAPGTTVTNLARGGRSTRTFIDEGLWDALVAGLAGGDTVLIQFGHNDEDLTKPHRHTDPAGDFARNLTRFVADVRAKGASPVLLTPVARADFAGGTIAETHGAYAAAVRRVATATNTPFVDLDARSMAFFARGGEAGAARYFMIYTPADRIARFPEGHRDTTHLNELGARATAAIVAGALRPLATPAARLLHPVDPGRVRALGSVACG